MKQKTKTKVLIFVLTSMLIIVGFQIAQYHANANQKEIVATARLSPMEEKPETCDGIALNTPCYGTYNFCANPIVDGVQHPTACYRFCTIEQPQTCPNGVCVHAPVPGSPKSGICVPTKGG